MDYFCWNRASDVRSLDFCLLNINLYSGANWVKIHSHMQKFCLLRIFNLHKFVYC